MEALQIWLKNAKGGPLFEHLVYAFQQIGHYPHAEVTCKFFSGCPFSPLDPAHKDMYEPPTIVSSLADVSL